MSHLSTYNETFFTRQNVSNSNTDPLPSLSLPSLANRNQSMVETIRRRRRPTRVDDTGTITRRDEEEEEKKEDKIYKKEINELYQQYIKICYEFYQEREGRPRGALGSSSSSLINHICDERCGFLNNNNNKNLYICRQTGNIHLCTKDTCDYKKRQTTDYDEERCILTGIIYDHFGLMESWEFNTVDQTNDKISDRRNIIELMQQHHESTGDPTKNYLQQQQRQKKRMTTTSSSSLDELEDMYSKKIHKDNQQIEEKEELYEELLEQIVPESQLEISQQEIITNPLTVSSCEESLSIQQPEDEKKYDLNEGGYDDGGCGEEEDDDSETTKNEEWKSDHPQTTYLILESEVYKYFKLIFPTKSLLTNELVQPIIQVIINLWNEIRIQSIMVKKYTFILHILIVLLDCKNGGLSPYIPSNQWISDNLSNERNLRHRFQSIIHIIMIKTKSKRHNQKIEDPIKNLSIACKNLSIGRKILHTYLRNKSKI